nr:MAG TPA: hypothetical protein [Caudoviricetes sp.]
MLRGCRPKTLIFSRTLSLHIRSTIRQSAFSGAVFTANAEMTRSTTRRSENAARLMMSLFSERDAINAQHPERKVEMRG